MRKLTSLAIPIFLSLLQGCNQPLKTETSISKYDLQTRLLGKENPKLVYIPCTPREVEDERRRIKENPYHRDERDASPLKAISIATRDIVYNKLHSEHPIYRATEFTEQIIDELEELLSFRLLGFEGEIRTGKGIGLRFETNF